MTKNTKSQSTIEEILGLIAATEAKDIRLYVSEGNLKFNAPKGAMDESIIGQLKKNKEGLISYLTEIEEAEQLIEHPIPKQNGSNGYPLSFAQQRFWFLDRLAGGNSPIYNMLPIALEVTGKIDEQALQQSMDHVLLRHPILSNKFTIEGDEPRQFPGQKGQVPIEIYDLRQSLDSAEIVQEQVAQIILKEGEFPFDLETGGPLVRIGLIHLSNTQHVMILTLHHIVADGWSLGIIVDEFSILYESYAKGKRPRLAENNVQYGDFAHWERKRLNRSFLNRHLHYWKKDLEEVPTLLNLSTDRPRPRLQSFNGKTLSFMLEPKLSEELKNFAHEHGATPFMVLLSVFGIVLGRYARQKDLVIGTPMSIRSHKDCDPLVGLFLNTIPLRVNLTGEPNFYQVLNSVKGRTLKAFEYGEVPFEELLQALNIERNLNHTPLFQVLFALQNAPVGEMSSGDLTINPIEPENSKAPFDLVLSMEEIQQGIRGRFRYNTDLFDRETISAMSGHFIQLLTNALAKPESNVHELAMITDEERHALAVYRGDRKRYPVTQTIAQVIAQTIQAYPDKPALKYQDHSYTYREFGARADTIASELDRMGVQYGDRVGIFMERSRDLICVIYAVLKKGAIYVPMETSNPLDRIQFMIDDAEISVMVTDEANVDVLKTNEQITYVNVSELSDQRSDGQRLQTIEGTPEDVAYIIYTSGSTGRPKGVEVTNANVIRLFNSSESLFGFGANDVWTMFHSYAFDFSVWEIFGALLKGGCLVIVPKEVALDPKSFHTLLQNESVTVLNQTPSAFYQLAHVDTMQNRRLNSLKWVVFGGEALGLNNLKQWTEKYGFEAPELINMYGITETTVHVTFHKIGLSDVQKGLSIIGKPLPDLSIDICDEYGALVPIGVPGELLVGGDGLAKGYLNLPSLNEERFALYTIHDGLEEERLYRSGDLVKRVRDGSLHYLGRIDQQVKIRGYRIEIGEIEAQMSSFNKVNESVVVLRNEPTGSELIGYVTTHEQGQNSTIIQELREFLQNKLPDYMVPKAIVHLEKIPLTVNGKVNKKELPLPGRELRVNETTFKAPVTALEKEIAGLWVDILKLERVGLADNFFELGGDSIKGAIFANRMQEKTGKVFYVVALFEAPTIEELVPYIKNHYPEILTGYEDGVADLEEVETPLTETISMNDIVRFKESILPLPPYEETSTKKNTKAIFVLAPPRSGTTLLRVLLGGHTALFAPPELELMPFNTLAERKRVCSGRDAFWLEGTLRAIMEIQGYDADQAKAYMQNFENKNLSTKDFYAELQSTLGERILVDKSPSYVLDASILHRIEQNFEDAFFIHLHRHPLGMINSFVEAKLDQIFFRYPHEFNTKQLAELIWSHSHQNILEFLQTIPANRQVQISFEQMTANPEKEMQHICNHLELPFEPEMLQIYQENEKKRRMTDGIHQESKMLGDVKFHTHKGIDSSAAHRWKKQFAIDMLHPETQLVAHELGYLANSTSSTSEQHSKFVPQTNEPTALGTLNGDTTTRYPLSYAQKRLWFFDRLETGNNVYNMPISLRIEGDLNYAAMEQAIHSLTQKHSILRSRYGLEHSDPYYTISPKSSTISLVNIADLQGAKRLEVYHQWMDDVCSYPFDLEKGPLFRAVLLKTDKNSHVLVLNMHHIVSDGWSIGLIGKELESFYNKWEQEIASDSNGEKRLNESMFEDEALGYHEYTKWQLQLEEHGDLDRQIDYWKEQLSDIPRLLELPTDFPRPAIKSYKGKTTTFDIDHEQFKQLKKLAQQTKTTPYMVLMAVFGIILYKYTGEKTLPIGSPVANRKKEEFESLIGFFVNTLVVKLTLEPEKTFLDLLQHVRTHVLEALQHQDVSFEQLVEELEPERNMGFTPLFQVMLTMQTEKMESPSLNGVEVFIDDQSNDIAKYDLTLLFAEHLDGLRCHMEWSTDLFEEWRIKQLGGHFKQVLSQVLQHSTSQIQHIRLLNDEEEQRVRAVWNSAPRKEQGNRSIIECIDAYGKQTPDALAIEFHDRKLSYKQMMERSNQWAHYIRSLGIPVGSTIAVMVPRSEHLIIYLLGIWKAGCTYLPLDPEYPSQRIHMIFEDAKVALVITSANLKSKLPKVNQLIEVEKLVDEYGVFSPEVAIISSDETTQSIAFYTEEPPQIKVSSNDLAYIIFTSGSTGRPKGVMIPHSALMNFIQSMITSPGVGPRDKFLATTTIAFDIAVLEIWVPLVAGAAVCVADEAQTRNGEELLRIINEHKITLLQGTPATWQMMLDSGWNSRIPLRCLSGGEALPKTLALEILNRGSELWNLYGPTETTVYSAIYQCDKEAILTGPNIVSIGHPIDNTAIYILDDNLQTMPFGLVGELYIGGQGVASGYHGREDLTQERFIENPFELGHVIYRTGDLAYYNADGSLHYIGRADQQVKLRGYRIELSEIELHLSQYPGINNGAVAIVGEDFDAQLVAFVQLADKNNKIQSGEIIDYLSMVLPDYMVPKYVLVIDELPKTPNGKLDRKALSTYERLTFEHESKEVLAPRDHVERELKTIWESVLIRNNISINDNFFQIGGHSLIAVRLLANIQTHFKVQLPLAVIFQRPTIQEMAQTIRLGKHQDYWEAMVPLRKSNTDPKGTLFCIPGAGGNVLYMQSLVQQISSHWDIYGCQPPGLDGQTPVMRKVEDLASYYVDAISEQVLKDMPLNRVKTPFVLLGHSFGGLVAFELAEKLRQKGVDVQELIILDTPAPHFVEPTGLNWPSSKWFAQIAQIASHQFKVDLGLAEHHFAALGSENEQLSLLLERLIEERVYPKGASLEQLKGFIDVYKSNLQMDYLPECSLDGTKVSIYKSKELQPEELRDERAQKIREEPNLGWDRWISGTITFHEAPGDHVTMLHDSNVSELSHTINLSLNQIIEVEVNQNHD